MVISSRILYGRFRSALRNLKTHLSNCSIKLIACATWGVAGSETKTFKRVLLLIILFTFPKNKWHNWESNLLNKKKCNWITSSKPLKKQSHAFRLDTVCGLCRYNGTCWHCACATTGARAPPRHWLITHLFVYTHTHTCVLTTLVYLHCVIKLSDFLW